MAVQTKSLVPFAHVTDVERSIDFYSGLGFKVANSVVPEDHSIPVWAWLESEKANLMVGLASGPIDSSQQAILFYLYYDNIKRTHAALAELGHAPGEIKYPFYMPGGEFRRSRWLCLDVGPNLEGHLTVHSSRSRFAARLISGVRATDALQHRYRRCGVAHGL